MKRKILIITEKRSIAAHVILALRNHLNDSEIEILDFKGMGFFNFNIPSSLPISKSPFIIPVDWHYKKLEISADLRQQRSLSHHIYKVKIPEGNIPKLECSFFDIPDMTPLPEQLKFIIDRLDDYKDILLIPDTDHRGIHFCTQIVEEIIKIKPESKSIIKLLEFNAGIDKESILASFKSSKAYTGKNHYLYKVGKSKYYFDWLWSINSASIFGKALKIAGAKTDHILSKYELLTFLLIAKNKLPKVNTHYMCPKYITYTSMSKYRGSGKYKPIDCPWLGSPTSVSSILDNLIFIGLLDDNVHLTLEGDRFYDLVHKRSFDPDIGYRLEQWITSGDVEAMEKYIKTLFQRQKNFNSVTGLSTKN